MRRQTKCETSTALLFLRFLEGVAALIHTGHRRERGSLMRFMSCFRPLAIGVVCVLGSVAGWAQLDGTGLTGTVTDSTGRMIPEVQVMAIQVATGLRRETVSSGQGTYEITELPVGNYSVSFVREGFETLRFENVVQNLGRTRTLNATLKVAGAKEELEVLASPPSLDQTADTWGTGIERKQ